MTLPATRGRTVRRTAVAVLAVLAIGIFPWTVYLVYALPSRQVAAHWDIAWAGLDVAMGLAAAATAVALWRHHERLAVFATVTGTLLVCDAWFDAVTASGGDDVARAGIEAAVAELPMAALCFWIAWNAARLRAWTPKRVMRRG